LIALGSAFNVLSLKSAGLFIALALIACAGVGMVAVHLEKRICDQLLAPAIP
jgi:hypothetical protein